MAVVATANLGNRPNAVVARGLDRLAEQAWVIGVQEAGDRHEMLNRFCKNANWEMHYGTAEGSGSTPILWNPALVHVNHEGTRKATPATYCGPGGAGPNLVKAKVFNHIRVKPLKDSAYNHNLDPFSFVNGHWPASLYLPCRRNLGRQMVNVLDDMLERRDERIDVVMVGDFNQRPTSIQLKVLRAQGAHQWVHFATHGNRLIDHVWTLHRRANARPFKGTYSDHRWVLADIF